MYEIQCYFSQEGAPQQPTILKNAFPKKQKMVATNPTPPQGRPTTTYYLEKYIP